MEPASPLREAFTELLQDEAARSAFAADPGGFLAAYGHADLPDSLVTEAIASFADTTSPEVAEHLAPFVTRHWNSPDESNALSGLELLASAPAVDADVSADLDPGLDPLMDPSLEVGLDTGPAAGTVELAVAATRSDEAPELDFGTGAEPWDPRTPADDIPEPAEEAVFQAEFPVPLLDLPPVDPGIENVNVGEGAVAQTDEDAADGDIE